MQAMIDELAKQAEESLGQVSSKETLASFWQEYLSKNGKIPALMKNLRTVAPEERPAMGKIINELKAKVQAEYDAAAEKVKAAELAARNAAETVDITMPPKVRLNGSLHPITLVKNEIVDVFVLIAGTALSDKDDCTVVYLYDREKKTTTIDVYNTVTGEDLHTYEDILPGRGVEFIKK